MWRAVVVLALALLMMLAALVWSRLGEDRDTEDAPAPAATPQPPPEKPENPTSPPTAPRQTVQHAVVESGIAIRIVRRARVDPPIGPFAAEYARLESEARSGNMLSRYRLGLLLYECRDVPADEAVLGREVEAIHQTRRHGIWNVVDPDDEEHTLRYRYASCDGVPVAERGRFRDHLKSAADAGVIEAQINLPLKLPDAEYCQFLAECAPAQRAQQEALQKEAIDYVGRARDAGSVSALWTFAAWYAEGEVLPQDEVEAYAHFRALDQIDAASNQPRRFERLLGDLKRRLRPIDLDQGEARARELLSNPNCCVITP